MVATTITIRQCNYMESYDMCASLQVHVLPSNLQSCVVARLITQIGLNNGSLHGTHGGKNICALINHVTSDSISGTHLRDSIEAHKLEILFPGYIFISNLPTLSQCVTPSWISHTWNFMRKKYVLGRKHPPPTLPMEK